MKRPDNIPSSLSVFIGEQVEEADTDNAVAGLREGLLSILMFCIVFSPLILTGLYYIFNMGWGPAADNRGEKKYPHFAGSTKNSVFLRKSVFKQ